jgi:hypothetical protein
MAFSKVLQKYNIGVEALQSTGAPGRRFSPDAGGVSSEDAGHEAREESIAGWFQHRDLPLQHLLLTKAGRHDAIKVSKDRLRGLQHCRRLKIPRSDSGVRCTSGESSAQQTHRS